MKLRFTLVLLVIVLVQSGCESHSFYEFMPTPNLYLDGRPDPFDQVPPALQTEYAEVIYFTDRTPTPANEHGAQYGFERDRSGAFGTMKVTFGKDLTWETLVAQSRSPKRTKGMKVGAIDITEKGRYPETPEQLSEQDGKVTVDPAVVAARDAADQAFCKLLDERIALTPHKQVYIFIHGYNCEFEWPAYVMAQLWHFMGRTGVPVAYSWPAARPGLLRGYQYDRESGEFTVFHLKRFLKLVASCGGVEKVHIIGHSRGTDVATTALRELRIEYGDPLAARSALKMGTLVLAAADLDTEVASQRVSADKVLQVPERTDFYVSSGDRALGLSDWLFGSAQRVGMMQPKDLRSQAMQILLRTNRVEAVDAQVKTPKIFSHSYFFAHPAASSDLILLLRDGRPAGAENGRPLVRDPSGFWILKDYYPATQPSTKAHR
jgi:esterase/lipase superfamily enzyme